MLKYKLLKYSVLFVFVALISTSCLTTEVTSITFDSSEKSMILGQSDSIKTVIKYSGVMKPTISWSTTDKSVVSVSNGKITAQSTGTAVITASSDNVKSECTVTVSNEIHPAITQAELWYWGNAYGDLSNNFVIYLGSSGINMDSLSGNGEIIFLELNAPLTSVESIPAGTYEMVELDKTKFVPGTLVPAFIDDNGYYWGTWYFGNTTNDIISGNATISVTNNMYSIQYNLLDYFGNLFTGTFTGNMNYHNATTTSSVKEYNQMKMRSNRLLFKSIPHYKRGINTN